MCNVTDFAHTQFVRQKEIRTILSKVVRCYEVLYNDFISNGDKLPNDENKIRDTLHYKYLNDKTVRSQVKLRQYIFVPEAYEDNMRDSSRGRADLKVIIQSRTFANPQEYYTIECKRIDGSRKLNSEYVTSGIRRFADNGVPLYSSYYGTNGMIAFLVSAIDVNRNIVDINSHLKDNKSVTTTMSITEEASVKHCFKSSHQLNSQVLDLYHLMLDFSGIVN